MPILVLLSLLLLSSVEIQAKEIVAIIDTGVDYTNPYINRHLCRDKKGQIGWDFVDEDAKPFDRNGHGTHIATTIINNAEKASYCLLILRVFGRDSSAEETISRVWRAALYATEHGATLVNMSYSGSGASSLEEKVIKRNPKVRFIAAAGNAGISICRAQKVFPACYTSSNIIPVGNAEAGCTKLVESSNFGPSVSIWEEGMLVDGYNHKQELIKMSGTSQAAAICTGKLVAGKRCGCR